MNRARILVVEDEALTALDLESQLAELGHEVCGVADNGPEALALARRERPDLVLLDIRLKGSMDGIEVARALAGSGCAVVFLTAWNDEATVAEAVAADPTGWLAKPFDRRELAAAVAVALGRARAEQRLAASRRRFAATLRCVADAVVTCDEKGRVNFANPAAEALLGAERAALEGLPLVEVLPLALPAAAPSPLERALRGERADLPHGTRLLRTGASVPVEGTAAPIRDEAGTTLGAVVAFRDISARLSAERTRSEGQARFRRLFEDAPAGMALLAADGTLREVNAAFARLVGQAPEDLRGRPLSSLLHPEDAPRAAIRQRRTLARRGQGERLELRFLRRDGEVVWVLASLSALELENGSGGFLLQAMDITDRKRAEEHLEYLAHFDPLTGLANRSQLTERLRQMAAAAARHGTLLAVVFADLDNFKLVNDSLGHAAGDQLLRILGERLRSELRATDCAARLGGDEFVILLPDLTDETALQVVLERLRTLFSRPVQVGERELSVSASLGVSLCPTDGSDAEALLRYADAALYEAKAQGRNRIQRYRPELIQRTEESLLLDAALKEALERGEFHLHYQPITDLEGTRIQCIEALIRWRRDGREILPAAFIPAAEQTGQIVAIGRWVLCTALRDLAELRRRGAAELAVSVNVSARQFRDDDLPATVASALADAGLEPECLRLEVTEQLFLDDSGHNLETIERLRALGVGLVIDDFGVGFASLGYLKLLGPRKVKIDRSFVRDLLADGEDAAIVGAVIALCKNLGIQVVAEGVESEPQRRFLAERGCDFAQGFLFGRPMPLADLAARLGLASGDSL
ncbi:MAG: hypothetical protein KatS3mg124_0659 [Porticoccaceae bacterium]|nr:MAG: hypothetical protein KatS3mg124_0659 [Porticoccaceae bacterium]